MSRYMRRTALRHKHFHTVQIDFGSFVWREMDRVKTVFEIGQAVHRRFGAKSEPLYERLSKFLMILHDSHFIVYANKQKDGTAF